MKTFSVISLGCKVNAYECEACAQKMEECGYARVKGEDSPDVMIVFTCAVTNEAARKSRKMIRRARKLCPDGIVAAIGCYTQIDPDAAEAADVVIGTRHKSELADYIQKAEEDKKKKREVSVPETEVFEPLPIYRFKERTRAFLRIEDGCNQFCSYCVIPFARGRERSMNPDEVIEEMKRISAYHKEVVLTGIHTGRYGREYGITLSDLIRRILDEVPKLERLRISSIEISEIDDAFLSLLETNPRIARHLHIPLQSGCDEILKAMRRPYTTGEFLTRLKEIRSRVSDISVSTDLIVGFPGESDENFDSSIAFLKTCQFSFLHVFPFSLRTGTAAEKMDGHISAEEKKLRAKICLNLSEELYDRYKESMLGKEADVLVEKAENGISFGHSSEYLEVAVPGFTDQGTMIKARLLSLKDHMLWGERTDGNETERTV